MSCEVKFINAFSKNSEPFPQKIDQPFPMKPFFKKIIQLFPLHILQKIVEMHLPLLQQGEGGGCIDYAASPTLYESTSHCMLASSTFIAHLFILLWTNLGTSGDSCFSFLDFMKGKLRIFFFFLCNIWSKLSFLS